MLAPAIRGRNGQYGPVHGSLPPRSVSYRSPMVVGWGSRRRRQASAPTGSPAPVVAAALHGARTVEEVERVALGELRSWPELDLAWVTLASLVPGRATPTAGAAELPRILSRVPPAATEPLVVPRFHGEAVVAPCGVGSELALVVASDRDVPAALVAPIASLGAMIGLAARTIEANVDLDRRRMTRRFEEVVRFASDAIFIVEATGTIRYAAPSTTTVLGHRSLGLEGRPLAELVVTHQHADLASFLGAVALEQPRRPTSVEMLWRRADGSTVPVEVTGANLLGNADVRGIVVTVRDISARRDLEEQLRHRAFHDPLTGLANRALFSDRLERAMRVRRRSDELSPAVAFIDLDDFKEVNDTLGHAVGDTVLRTIGERIAGCLRGSDTAARLGGDEFALLLEDVPDERTLQDLVTRVVDAVRQPITVDGGGTVCIRASVGIASSGADVVTADDLLRHADLAMYRDKSAAKAEVIELPL